MNYVTLQKDSHICSVVLPHVCVVVVGECGVSGQDQDQSTEPGGPGWLRETERHSDCWPQTQGEVNHSL